MARLTKEEKRIEKETDAAFKSHGSNVQFDIFDLGKIHQAGVNAGRLGQNIEEAVKAAIQTYRKN
jgi:hypothetical protein